MKNYDVVIIGGGAAGIFAALSVKAHHPQKSVLIVDRTFSLGRKILVSGAGRCNLTNSKLGSEKWRRHYHTDTPQLLDSVFAQFSYFKMLRFFKDLGILTYEEQKNAAGKIFPITDSARNVLLMLQDELQRKGVAVLLEHSCTSINNTSEGYELQLEDASRRLSLLKGGKIILATGGKTYPALGSDGSGYKLAEGLGHLLLTPVPAAGPLLSSDKLCKELQGVRLPVAGELFIDGKLVIKNQDDLLFTSYGVSGSLIFGLSRPVAVHYREKEAARVPLLRINFTPGLGVRELEQYLKEQWRKRPGQLLEHSLLGLIPQKVAAALLKRAGYKPQRQVQSMSDKERRELVAALQQVDIKLTGTRGWNESEFTAGGVRTSEVNERTLESKKSPGVYLCGELLNVDGDIGGFNLSWAWASGWVAGKLQD